MDEKLETLSTNNNIEILDLGNSNVESFSDVNKKVETLTFDNNENKFSVIKTYGENLTIKEYITDPAIGREQEINEMMLALITPDKGALLVGKPGIGKTSIVEGLGYRIQHNLVPNALKGWSIIKINISSLLGTTSEGGNTES